MASPSRWSQTGAQDRGRHAPTLPFLRHREAFARGGDRARARRRGAFGHRWTERVGTDRRGVREHLGTVNHPAHDHFAPHLAPDHDARAGHLGQRISERSDRRHNDDPFIRHRKEADAYGRGDPDRTHDGRHHDNDGHDCADVKGAPDNNDDEAIDPGTSDNNDDDDNDDNDHNDNPDDADVNVAPDNDDNVPSSGVLNGCETSCLGRGDLGNQVRHRPMGLGIPHVQEDAAAGDRCVEAPQRGEAISAESSQNDNGDDIGKAEHHDVAKSGRQQRSAGRDDVQPYDFDPVFQPDRIGQVIGTQPDVRMMAKDGYQ